MTREVDSDTNNAAEATVTVVIPTHNRAHLVERALASAAQNTVEIIVVDDASTDETPLELPDLAARYGAKYVRLEQNRGPGVARNIGLRIATGELIVFLDDDDSLVEGALGAIRRVAALYPETDLYFHNCVYPDGSTSVPIDMAPKFVRFEEFWERFFDIELKTVVRRRLFASYEFPDTGASGEGLLWHRVIRDKGAVVSGEPIIIYDTSGADRLTSARVLLRNSENNARIADRWLELFGSDLRRVQPVRWARRVLGASTYHLLSRRRAHARSLLRQIPRDLLPFHKRAGFVMVSHLPLPVARLLFVLQRRELLRTMRPPSALLETVFDRQRGKEKPPVSSGD